MHGMATEHSRPAVAPTRSRDYALVNGSYMSALAALGVILHRRQRGDADPVTSQELMLLALATFAISDVFAHERIATWIRAPFAMESGDHRPERPRGRGLRYVIGELMECSRCMGSWSALGLIGLRAASPAAAGAVTAVFAVAGANDFLQAAFRLLSEVDNEHGES